ncbi:MAG: hypothetical protein AAFW69_00475 [Pseudomonadota bacterium]
MVLYVLIKLKKLAFAQQVVTGAFINGALVGLGVAAIAAGAAKAATSSSRAGQPIDEGDPVA